MLYTFAIILSTGRLQIEFGGDYIYTFVFYFSQTKKNPKERERLLFLSIIHSVTVLTQPDFLQTFSLAYLSIGVLFGAQI